MAKTMIADVIIPAIFAPYVIKQTKELSNIIQSGIAISNPALDELVAKGGKLINMPFWQPITGDDEVLSDSSPLTPGKITAEQDVAAELLRGKAWSANELAGALAGSSPMEAIGTQVAQWWVIQEQKVLLSILKGIFDGPLAATHVNNISGAANSKISAYAILDTKQLLGDAANQLTSLVMHSAVFTELQKQNLIEYIPNSQGVIQFPTYLGYNIVVDDGTTMSGGVFNTYLFSNGCFGRGEGLPVDLTPVETSRDALAGDDILVNRRAFCLHPFGIKFTNASVTGVTPSNTDLANVVNWKNVVENKRIGMAMLKHTLEDEVV